MAVAKPERASRPVSNILRMADLYLSDARSRFTWGGGSVCVCVWGRGGGRRERFASCFRRCGISVRKLQVEMRVCEAYYLIYVFIAPKSALPQLCHRNMLPWVVDIILT